MSSPLTGRRRFTCLSRISLSARCRCGGGAGDLVLQKAVSSTETGRSDWRGALSSFSGRLHWHCHFIRSSDHPSLETSCSIRLQGLRPTDPALLDLVPRRDRLAFRGCLHDHAARDRLSNSMRAMLMAVASYHLWLDWRGSGLHLARMFTDYEPGIHWSQVQMQSGTTGINTPRIYNPVKQSMDQDPEGIFIRRWLPALADVPAHDPHPGCSRRWSSMISVWSSGGTTRPPS